MMKRTQALVLMAATLAGCASAGPPVEGPAPGASTVEAASGCWTLTVPGSRRRVLPALSVLRLDTMSLSGRPEDGMRLRLYVPGQTPRRVVGRSAWMQVEGGESLQLRLEDEYAGVEARVRVTGNRMTGQVRNALDPVSRTSDWTPLRGARVNCPAELS